MGLLEELESSIERQSDATPYAAGPPNRSADGSGSAPADGPEATPTDRPEARPGGTA